GVRVHLARDADPDPPDPAARRRVAVPNTLHEAAEHRGRPIRGAGRVAVLVEDAAVGVDEHHAGLRAADVRADVERPAFVGWRWDRGHLTKLVSTVKLASRAPAGPTASRSSAPRPVAASGHPSLEPKTNPVGDRARFAKAR